MLLRSIVQNAKNLNIQRCGQGNTPKPGVDNYAVYNGMGVAADQVFGNMTTALKAKEMYNNTLIVLTSGPLQAVAPTTIV